MKRSFFPLSVLAAVLTFLALSSSAPAQTDSSASEHRIDLSSLPSASGVELDRGEPTHPALKVALPNAPQPKGVRAYRWSPRRCRGLSTP